MRFWTGKMLPNAVVFPLPTKLRGVCLIDGGFLDMLMGVLWLRFSGGGQGPERNERNQGHREATEQTSSSLNEGTI